MKKVISIMFVLVAVFVVSGCGKTQVLECKITEEQSGLSMEMVSEFTFKGDTATVVDLAIKMESTEAEAAEGFELMAPIMDGMYEEFASVEGVTYKSEVSATEFSMNFSIDYDVVSDADLDTLGDLDFDIDSEERTGKIEDLKASLESEGYTCKIK